VLQVAAGLAWAVLTNDKFGLVIAMREPRAKQSTIESRGHAARILRASVSIREHQAGVLPSRPRRGRRLLTLAVF
jgi:uncharacterized protein (DUF58 family)